MTLFMAPAPDGRTWFGSYLGIGYDAGEGRIEWLNLPNWAITRISGILPVRTNELWVALRPGLAHLQVDGTNGIARTLPGFSHVHVTSLCADGPDAFWAGTIDHGLIHFQTGREPLALHASHGLDLHRIHSIIPDRQTNLWLATERGIARIEATSLRQALQGSHQPLAWRLFTEQDGIPSRETSFDSQPIASASPDGRLWFATTAGLASVDPSQPPESPALPAPLIDEVSSSGSVRWALYGDENGRPNPDTFGPGITRIALPRGRREIEFRFTAPAPALAGSSSFRHRLVGVDRNWITTGTRRSALYQTLPPGDHRFEVQVLDAAGNPTTSTATFEIEVPHFLWERTAFQVANAAILVGLVAVSSRWIATRRLRRRLAAIERERSIERERARIARDMHDQLGSDLTRVKLLGEMTRRDLADPARARAHIERLARTTLDLVRGLDEIVWAVNPAKDRLDNFLSYLGAYATEFSESTGIACRTDLPAEIQSQTLPASIRHNLFLVVKESLNNAAKHAVVHEVHVRVQVLDHQVQVEVSDAGTGFDPASIRHGRHGLASLRQRMAEIGGEIRWETAPGKGTRVVARVPLPH
jgi:signal transduction histidine kinase